LAIIWIAIDPPSPERKGEEGERYFTCESSIDTPMSILFYLYNGTLLIAGVYLAFQTRKVWTANLSTTNSLANPQFDARPFLLTKKPS